jgi:MazG family protein
MAEPSNSLENLAALVATLRGPRGCPWDSKQGIEDIRGYLLEEAHEVAAAIDGGDWDEICSELGDLLFQVVFIAQIAREQEKFDLEEVTQRIEEKMISRHPHVFGTESLDTSEAVHQAWERRKAENRTSDESILAGVPASLPALLGAYRMTQKAAGVGFDWSSSLEVLSKLGEELAELQQALDRKALDSGDDAILEEVGDVLFTVANLARKVGEDPESALAAANQKFRRRFARMEAELADQNRSITNTPLDELELLWAAVKRQERRPEPDRPD